MTKTSLLGKTLDELKSIATGLGMPSFTGKQIAEWIYQKRVSSIDEMSNISLKNRALLNEQHEVGRTLPVESQVSVDGTVKYLFKTAKNQFIESVFIPEEDRATLCVSSQVGCKMNCLFCMTGKQGFGAQLTVQEILNQYYSIPESGQLTNIVFMGMGEPLDNLDNVLKTLEILTADYALGWSPKRITVSTIGLIPGMKRFLESSNCHLAVSMHSPFEEERLKLMPVQKAYPILKVLEELKNYDFSKQRRVSFEYIMFNGLNDTPRHAREMAKLLKGIDCRVNLIRYHAIPGIDLKTSDENKMIEFRDYLTNNGIMTTIRKSRGEDIFAACGMLSSSKHA
ncbi:Dual-specificity RNA methyltransferase RlmN [bioreactor metagenome]|jgi:23S rRNA (adenine2503-C2)-methyltransferase|uniref:Dual-specificity RNA methyltransferase RlmN n=1 Tax=bioreactor metagenome TaxID=1076179 RepID=A0A644VIB8_9ZZZZ|nr:23S rRNA (adenine(2503)-C(2))-methyltransferase RlmN [Paludibacter sp.]